jgi:APA family basic amino acid/polyamine antiporter
VAAFTNIFWAYEGWYQLPFNAAELKRPERQLPLGLIIGMVILIVTYLAVNAIYLHVVPFGEMQTMPKKDAEQMVPLLTVTRIFGAGIASYLTLLISISVFGSANPNMLSSPRAFYAMGQDGLVPRALNWVHPRWGTPTVSIWVQAIWALALVGYLQKFSDITDFVVFAGFLFYALTVASVYRLRRSRPELARPYRCTGYPWTPALFILVAVGFVAAMLTTPERRMNALYGLAILAAGLPVYLCQGWWMRRRASPS